ncbi:MAG: Fimbrin, actin-bundling protein [Cyphobasidiales sp. Tagirdzhanova-0007]|nr:MAG: Fimbrin, actin-bundling protein [Cyphobasidiales sp. Tagirdzhanova-0007]
MSVLKLRKRFPELEQQELMQLISSFNALDTEGKESVDRQDVAKSLAGQGVGTYDQVRETLKDVQVDATGRVALDDYVELVSKLRAKQGGDAGAATIAGRPGVASQKKAVLGGATATSSHTIDQEEKSEFTRHINDVLAGDADIGERFPIPTDTMQLFDETRDGLVLCKLINDSVPDTIDERVLNKPSSKTHRRIPSQPNQSSPQPGSGGPKALNNFQMTENNNIVISSAKAIGCSVVNVGSTDLVEGREHLVLGLIWQIIRRGLLSKIDIKLHPELYRLLEDGESLEQFLRLPPDQILLRWFNYHLKAANWPKKVNNFSKDIQDGENYTVLLNQLKPADCSRSPLQTRDVNQRAEQVLENAHKIGCRKYLTAKSLVAGNPKLNLAFVANLFNTWPGLEPLEDTERPEIEDFDAEGEREARVFTLWLNSLEVDPSVNNLFEDLRDGVVILQAFDKVIPGTVIWRRVSKPKFVEQPVELAEGEEPKPPLSRFKMVENTNYGVELAKANRMHIVGIQGADIVDGSKTLTLGLVWQLMRMNIVKTLASLSKGGKDVTDSDIVKWANETVKKGGKNSTMKSFKDGNNKNAIFFLDLLDSLKPGYVDYSLVYPGKNDEECRLNAKLAISIARKLGSLIFLTPEDIVELRAKLILTFVGSLMALQLR